MGPYLGLMIIVVEERSADEAHQHVLVVVLPPACGHALQHLKQRSKCRSAEVTIQVTSIKSSALSFLPLVDVRFKI